MSEMRVAGTGTVAKAAPTAAWFRALAFAEPDNNEGAKVIWTWFAHDDTRPLFCFAGIWREWEGDRGTKGPPI